MNNRCSSNGILWWLIARIGTELELDLPLFNGVFLHVSCWVVLEDTYSWWWLWLQNWRGCALLLRSYRCGSLHLAELSRVRWLREHPVCWHLDIIIDLWFECALRQLVFLLLSLLLFDGFPLCLHVGTLLASIKPLSNCLCLDWRSCPLVSTAKPIRSFWTICVWLVDLVQMVDEFRLKRALCRLFNRLQMPKVFESLLFFFLTHHHVIYPLL